MSADADRIAVPTNGRRPHAVTIGPEEAPGDDDHPIEPGTSGVPTATDMATAMSPRQVAVGFAILASLGVLLAGRVLRRRSGR
jgi:hypothetical protein